MIDRTARPIYIIIAASSLFIIMFGIKATAVIINPILLALIITIAVLPLPGLLAKRGMSHKLALVLTILLVVGVIVAVMLLFGFGIYSLIQDLPTYADDIEARSQEFADWYNDTTSSDTSALSSQQHDALVAIVVGLLANFLVQVGMTLLIFIFMIFAAISSPSGSLPGTESTEGHVDRANKFTADVRRYLNVTTVINFTVGMLDAVMLTILGVDYALLWGLLAWLLGYIPTIGFWLALIPPTILAWAQYGITEAFIVFMGFVLINGSVQNFIQPKLMGDNLRISPLIVFLSLFVWGWLLGGVGAILAVPLTLLILTFLDNFDQTRGLARLARTPSDGDSEADEQEKQKARQQIGGWWQRSKEYVSPGSATPAEE